MDQDPTHINNTLDNLNHRHQKPDNNFFKKLTKNKSTLISLLAVLVLFIGLATGVWLTQRTTFEEAEASGTAQLSLVANPQGPFQIGDEFDVNIQIDPDGEDVTAAEIHVMFDKTKLEVVNDANPIILPPSPFLTEVLPNCLIDNPENEPCPATSTYRESDNDGIASIYLGVLCTDDESPSCDLPANNTGLQTLGVLRLKAISGGTTSISYKTAPAPSIPCTIENPDPNCEAYPEGTWVAALDHGVTHANSEPTGTTVTIEADQASCVGDVNGDGYVDSTDFGLVVSNFDPLNQCPAGDPCVGDVNGDGYVDSTDFGLVVSNFDPLNQCD